MSNAIVKLKNFSKTYGEKSTAIHVFKETSLTLNKGECVALVAPSGTGKSTLLHVLGLLDSHYSGQYFLNSRDTSTANEHKRTAFRRNEIGFIYQFHHLMPEFTAIENIMMPLWLMGTPKTEATEKAETLLKQFGLGARAHHKPGKLSGGEQQRVAILRAVVKHPSLLLADEPTGNLDEATSDIVFGELLSLVRNQHMTALIATHNQDLAKRMDRVITLKDGHIIDA